MNNTIEETIKTHINETETRFIFPTQTAADLWADRATLTCGVTAVAMERFIAWDDFKGTSIKAKHQDKRSIPGVFRKLFAQKLIEENAESPFLKNIISEQYAKSSSGFNGWISSILPSLNIWKKNFDKAVENNEIEKDEEDQDLNQIYEKYKKFLDENNFFDPAWETPPFESDGHHYIIFFPEILSDYTEYKEILNESEDITLVHLEKNNFTKPHGLLYGNARTEIRQVALYLRKKFEEGISFQNMAVSVPDMESYGPYIEREFSLYDIPFVLKQAKPLSSISAGNLFSIIKDCMENNFNYNCIKNLLLNKELPWADEISIMQLIAFGEQNNCITDFNYNGQHYDIWERSFDQLPSEKRAKDFFDELKTCLTSIYDSKSFSEIRENYFIFRNKFFDMKKCTQLSDIVLSRCISELGGLIDLEKEYPEACKIPGKNSYYNFFTSYLDDTNYLKQTKQMGVQILPYKTSACAPFEIQVLVNASQNDLNVVYKALSFLREDKRRKIIFGGDKTKDDPNVTEAFIQLYKMNSTKESLFTCSSKKIEGYAQCSSYLEEIDLTKNAPQDFSKDFISQEKNWMLEKSDEFPNEISLLMKTGFSNWIQAKKTENNISTEVLENDRFYIKNFLDKNGKIKVSGSDIKKYLNCPRSVLWMKAAGITEENHESSLMKSYATGNLYHKVLELFFTKLKSADYSLAVSNDFSLTDDYKKILNECLTNAISEEMQTDLDQQEGKSKNSFLTTELLKASQNALYKIIEPTVTNLCSVFNGYKVYCAEKWFSYPAKDSEEYKKSSFVINGKIDLILNKDNRYIIVDYKSSKIPDTLYSNNLEDPTDKTEYPADIQIPMYLKLTDFNNGYSSLEIQNTCFFNISENKITAVTGDDLFKELLDAKKICSRDNFIPTMEYLEKCIKHYVDSISNGDFDPDDKIQTFEVCRKCDCKALCRRSFNICKGK